MDEGVNVDEADSTGATPLLYAAWSDKLNTFEFLVSQGANVNAQDNGTHVFYSFTQFIVVSLSPAIFPHLFFFLFILNSLLLVDGLAPIHAAAYFPNLDILDQLIAIQECDINIQTKAGDTPLHYAVLSGSLDSVITLLNAGADLNIMVCRRNEINLSSVFYLFSLRHSLNLRTPRRRRLCTGPPLKSTTISMTN